MKIKVASIIFVILGLISFNWLGAQKLNISDSSLIQLSGVVVSDIDLNPIPYTTVYDKTLKKV